MLIPLGVLAAAGGVPPVPPAYELISTTILGSATPSVSFSNLGDYSSTYKHLQIRTTMRSSRTGYDGDLMALRLNGDTGGNYSAHALLGTGSVAASDAGTNLTSIYISYPTAASSTANSFTGVVFDLLDPYAAKNKTVRFALGNGAAGFLVTLSSGAWMNTASLTSLTFSSMTSSNFVAGSRFSLYGIKG